MLCIKNIQKPLVQLLLQVFYHHKDKQPVDQLGKADYHLQARIPLCKRLYHYVYLNRLFYCILLFLPFPG